MDGIKVIDFAYVRRDAEGRPLRPQPKNNVYFRRDSCSPPTPIDEIFLGDNKCFDDNLILFRKQLPVRKTRDEEERSRPENEIDSQFDPEDDYQTLTFPKTRHNVNCRSPVPELVEDITTDEDSDHTPNEDQRKPTHMTEKLSKHDFSDLEQEVDHGNDLDKDIAYINQSHSAVCPRQQLQPRLLLGLLLWNTLCHTFQELLISTQRTLARAEDYIQDAHILHHKHSAQPIPISLEDRYDSQTQVHANISRHQAIFNCVVSLILCLMIWAFSCVACFFGLKTMLQAGFVLFCFMARPDQCFGVVQEVKEKKSNKEAENQMTKSTASQDRRSLPMPIQRLFRDCASQKS